MRGCIDNVPPSDAIIQQILQRLNALENGQSSLTSRVISLEAAVADIYRIIGDGGGSSASTYIVSTATRIGSDGVVAIIPFMYQGTINEALLSAELGNAEITQINFQVFNRQGAQIDFLTFNEAPNTTFEVGADVPDGSYAVMTVLGSNFADLPVGISYSFTRTL